MQNFEKISDLIVENNNQYIIVRKPAGMACVPDKSGDINLKNLVESYCKHDVHVLTRIDRPVSGLALFAKGNTGVVSLAKQLQEGQFSKKYLAIVEGKLLENNGKLTNQLVKNKNQKAVIAQAEDKEARSAELSYHVLEILDNYTIVEITLLTGRFHQIRAQFSIFGFPIKGDVKYGARRKNNDRSIYLHAFALSFLHPVTHHPVSYTCLPDQSDNLWQLAVKSMEKDPS